MTQTAALLKIPADELLINDVIKASRTTVHAIDLCASFPWTHLHINDSNCYDGRSVIEVLRP